MAYKLKDGSGQEHEYSKEKLKIPSTTDGEFEVFTKGEVQEEKSVTITQNGTTEVMPDTGFGSVKKVGVAVDVPTTTVEPLTVTENGTTTAPDGKAYSPVTVNVPIPEYKVPQWNYEGINFVAWDGTLVASWTLEELQAKTELPAIGKKWVPPMEAFPIHFSGQSYEFTTSTTYFGDIQGAFCEVMSWNSTLEEIKSNNAPAVIGMCYLTSTRIGESDGSRELSAYSNPAQFAPMIIIFDIPSGGATINWGYSALADAAPFRMQRVVVSEGNAALLGVQGSLSPIEYSRGGTYAELICIRLLQPSQSKNFNRFPARLLADDSAKYVKGFLFPGTHENERNGEYGNFAHNGCVSFAASPFVNCTNLKHIALSPVGYTVGNGQYSPFDGDYSLESVSIPLGVDTYSGEGWASFRVDNLFAQLTDNERLAEYSLKMVTVPRMGQYGTGDDYKDTSNAMMLNTKSLFMGLRISSLTPLVTSESQITTLAGELPQMEIVDLTAIVYGVIKFSDGFGFGSHLKKIKVPASLVDQYKAAAGWSDYADFIVGV